MPLTHLLFNCLRIGAKFGSQETGQAPRLREIPHPPQTSEGLKVALRQQKHPFVLAMQGYSRCWALRIQEYVFVNLQLLSKRLAYGFLKGDMPQRSGACLNDRQLGDHYQPVFGLASSGEGPVPAGVTDREQGQDPQGWGSLGHKRGKCPGWNSSPGTVFRKRQPGSAGTQVRI